MATVRRQLFTRDDTLNRNNSTILTDEQIQSRISLPFKPKVGDNSMLFESKRFSSFDGLSDAKAKDLASSGFVLKSVNKIVCVFCGKQSDCPSVDICLSADEVHKLLNPNCPFIRGFQLGNVTSALESAIERDNQGNGDDNMHIEQSEDDTLIDDTANSINSFIAPIICFPQFEDREIRKKTFKNWSAQMRPMSLQLTEAGFFYSGTGDKVTCYSCAHSLSEWHPEADAKVEHAKHSPGCVYLQSLTEYQEIKQRASQTQTMTTCEIENSDPTVLPGSPVKLSSPFKPSMDGSIIPGIQAALASQFDLQVDEKSIHEAISQFYTVFKSCPNFPLLVGWMVAARDEYTMMQEMRGNIHVKDQQIEQDKRQIEQDKRQIEQRDQQIERDRRQRELHRQQIYDHSLEILAREREHINTTYRISEKERQNDKLSAENRQLKLELQLLKANKRRKDLILNVRNERISQLEDFNTRSNNTIMQLRRELQMSTSRRG